MCKVITYFTINFILIFKYLILHKKGHILFDKKCNTKIKKWVKNKEYLVLCHYLSSFVNYLLNSEKSPKPARLVTRNCE